jgi:hypothetical protein
MHGKLILLHCVCVPLGTMDGTVKWSIGLYTDYKCNYGRVVPKYLGVIKISKFVYAVCAFGRFI